MKKLVALFLVAGFIAFLFGCSNVNSWYMIEDNPEPKAGIIDEHGQLPAPIRFDSGAKLETTEDNTLVENVVVNVNETKSYDAGRNPIGTPEYIYIYGITAKLVDSLGGSTEVSSLEKPFKLTLPAGHLGTEGICYAGVREDKSSPWKYTRLSENGVSTLSQRSIRASGSGAVRSSYEFSLYRMGVEIALFVYNKPPEEAQKDISCAGITAASETPLLTLDKDGKYLNDLDMDIKLAGDNLSILRNSDVTVSIIFRNKNNSMPKEIKVNDQLLRLVTKSDEAVSGKDSYVHILTLDKNSFKAFFGGEASIKFKLGLNGISCSEFPTDFTVEVNSADNVENLIPFSYSEKVSCQAEAVYTITYDLVGGNLAEGDTNPGQYTAASESFTLKNPVKEGYTFAGWTGTGLSSATMLVSIEKGSIGNREYKATWNQNAPDTYTLTVEKGTGIATVLGSGDFEADKEITLEYTLEDGYEFASWTSDDVTVTDNKFTMPAKDVTITANASVITYSISYDGLDGADVVTNPMTYDVTSAAITLNNPTKAGYTFKGWCGTDLTGDENLTVTIAQGSTGDKTYTANWSSENYRITCDLNGGSLAEGVTNPEFYDITSSDITLKNPTRTGYTFKGWSGTNLTGDENLTVTIAQGSTGDKTYTANWSLVNYTITYNGIEGAAFVDGDNPETYNVESEEIKLNNPTKDGYTFNGWSGDGLEGDTNLEVIIAHGSTENKTYTANWTPISYAIAYELNGGSLAEGLANPTSYDITSDTITLYNPTKANYDFLGWTGIGIEEGTASMTVTIPQGSMGDRSYVASWTLGSVMTFNLAEGVELEMRRCPAGIFLRTGRDGYGDNNYVKISKDFYMGTYEVTNEQYYAIMSNNPSSSSGADFTGDRQPVVNVSWNDIMTDSTGFISKLNAKLTETGQLPSGYKFALPTEAQWEYACRAGTETDLNSNKDIENDWANDPNTNEVAWNWPNWGTFNNRTHDVGGLASNSFGLYDIHGNVWEWCADWYSDYDGPNLTDPTGPAEFDPSWGSGRRVLRGGGWQDYPCYCTSWCRDGDAPNSRDYYCGFRLGLVPGQEED